VILERRSVRAAERANLVSRLAAQATLLAACLCSPAYAQWIYYPNPNLPRTADGQLDVDAPTPKLANGKPDLSGLWENDNALKYLQNLAADLEGDVPFQPWARELMQERVARRGADDPNNFCLPSGIVMKHAVPAPFKIVQLPDLVVILYESRTIFRQIFTDGRPFPEDPQPAWHGYSVGHWEGDTLVVESMGFNDKFWLDTQGRPSTEQLRVIERFSRPTFGRLEVEITIDDEGAYTAPWTAKQTMHYLPDTDLIEHICEENNKFPDQLGE
jgi:hypothetical protein